MNEGDLIELSSDDREYRNLTTGQVYYSQTPLKTIKSFLCDAEPEFKEEITFNENLIDPLKRNVKFTNDNFLMKSIESSKQEETPANLVTFRDIIEKLYTTYEKKNHDYGNSFDESLDKFGLVASAVRLSDKMNRFTNLIGKDNKVNESITDTLLDAANYCIMTVMWLNKQ
jgi:hypothetical protein